ncbi:Ribosomal biogenesis regulatory protein like protein [Aduncisulcus paluster]|uniref:Ribosome biogenesis regulatory protein n=1 Tax=Aduncisulcus paluster TaxID=2918883 RepID=A0ABQ5K1U5_9EUKA|nr:Ribosomal biogenesis regulatory protein like protein [Aduncisulcus paluster]
MVKLEDIIGKEEEESPIKDSIKMDLFHLTAVDNDPVDLEKIDQISAENVQILIKSIFSLPREDDPELGHLCLLPKSRTKLPRDKMPPPPKVETPWEKFAKERGIKSNKKRDKLVFEQMSGEYKPRFGKNKALKGIEALPIVEAKKGVDDFDGAIDPWKRGKQEKKKMIQKQDKRERTNKRRAAAARQEYLQDVMKGRVKRRATHKKKK